MPIILAIDYGEKRIGMAISDEYAQLALPYETIVNENLKTSIEKINQIVQEENVSQIVVGLPKGLNGQESNKQELGKFVNKLKEVVKIPVELFDERMSSKAADRFKLDSDKRETGWRDKVAATIILQDYLKKIEIQEH
jgi:putative Holliday junction resolvase